MDPSIPQLVNLLLSKEEHNCVEIEARIRGEIANPISIRRLLCHTNWTETKYLERRRISKVNRKCTYRHRELYSPIFTSAPPLQENITICKSSLAKDELYNLWCTIHVSTEINVPTMFSYIEDVEAKDITRMRATMHDHWIDVTYDSDDKTYDSARVEIEVPGSSMFDPERLVYAISYVCSILQDSVPIMVEKLDWTTTKYLVKQPFGAFCIGTKSYQKPITMIKNDVMKVLSENSRCKKNTAQERPENLFSGLGPNANSHFSCAWLATPKADGVRCMMYILEGIVLSVDMAGSVRHVCTSSHNESSPPLRQNSNDHDVHDVSILDCEYLDNTYYIIDLPVYNGKYIGNMPINKRLKIIQDILSDYFKEHMHIVLKPYKMFSSFFELEKLYTSWLQKYNIDGIIFVNSNEGYFQRVLKWKDTNTIDLEVTENINGLFLQTCDGYTLDINRITVTNINLLTLGIWEFKYFIKDSVAVLEPIRHRPDKPRANSLNIVQKNTKFDVLPTGLFTGIECFLMRKYHNKQKAIMLSDSHMNNAVIMDIGTGQGGDINKWRTAKTIYCIEPDKNALKELRKRIEQNKPKFEVYIIECLLCKLELNNINPNPKISIFTAFFCMNLWQDQDWMTLKHAVKDKGSANCKFIGIALTNPVEDDNKCWTLKITSDTTYTLSIHNTRIINVSETIVPIQKLNDFMKHCGLLPSTPFPQRLNNRTIMTDPENTLSNMYTAFVYSKKNFNKNYKLQKL